MELAKGYTERISLVKESKIRVFIQKYEVFKMQGETITQMYNWFNNINIGIKGLGKSTLKVESNRNLLASLHKE